MIDDATIDACLLRLAEASGPTGSVSPNDVARALAPEWRPLLGAVRRAAVRLAEAQRIDILRKGKPVPPAAMHGVVRLRIRPQASEADVGQSDVGQSDVGQSDVSQSDVGQSDVGRPGLVEP